MSDQEYRFREVAADKVEAVLNEMWEQGYELDLQEVVAFAKDAHRAGSSADSAITRPARPATYALTFRRAGTELTSIETARDSVFEIVGVGPVPKWVSKGEQPYQPACQNHAPHSPHNGFASDSRVPWCRGVAAETLAAGIYRHYKGPLYLVMGLGHDANADEWEYRDAYSGDSPYFPDGRDVVIYIGLELEGSKPGPRWSVRTLEDFFAHVCHNADHEHYGEVDAYANDPDCDFRPRFEYVGLRTPVMP